MWYYAFMNPYVVTYGLLLAMYPAATMGLTYGAFIVTKHAVGIVIDSAKLLPAAFYCNSRPRD